MLLSLLLASFPQMIMILIGISLITKGVHQLVQQKDHTGIMELATGTILLVGTIEALKYILL